MNNIKLSAMLNADAEWKASLPKPSTSVLDKIADERITGKYDVVRRYRNGTQKVLHVTCKVCFVKKAANGSCNCE